MRLLLFSIFTMSLLGCGPSEYNSLQKYDRPDCLTSFLKSPASALYQTSIDVYGKHLSGLLFVKEMEDGRYRTVFTNEAGVTFFDFEFSGTDGFKVHKIISQLDRKPVITTLQKDFTLMLRIPFMAADLPVFRRGDEILMASDQKTGTAYFITDADCASLRRLEWGSGRKRIVSITMDGPYEQPTSIKIDHHTFDMTIALQKIERD